MKQTHKKPRPSRWLMLGVSINAPLREKLRAAAAAQQRSVSSLVRIILSDYFSRSPKP